MSTLRLHVPGPLVEGHSLRLSDSAARHVQVWRLQPGDALRLFDGQGGEHQARIAQMSRQGVTAIVGAAVAALPELRPPITLAVGMPANERMDTLVEKATELGVHAIQPLECERSVLRLSGERASRKREHWQAVAAAASAQCGRAVVPRMQPVQPLAAYLDALGNPSATSPRLLLSLQPQAVALARLPRVAAAQDDNASPWVLLSGPEGGLSPGEESAAQSAGFKPVRLGPRVLRADTAPLAAQSWLMLENAD